MAVKFQLRRDTAANWTAANTVLDLGEPGFETDTRKLKIGDGATPWNSLDYTIIQDFAELSNTPTTLAGYGITDAASSSDAGLAQTALQPGDAFDVKGSVFGDDSTLLVDAVNNIFTGNLTGNVTGQVSDISNFTSDNLTQGSTNLYYTDTAARAAVSVTDSGGDGSLAYDNGTGVFTYTGPSAAEVRAHFSAGTGVTITNGEVAIGQGIGTGSSPTFANITTSGYLRGPASFTIDPAAYGDDTGTVVIAGNLQVDGTTTTINSTTLTVDDKNIILAQGAADAAAAAGGGITVAGANAQLTYDNVQDRWNMNKGLELLSVPLVVGTGTTDVGRLENDSGVLSLTAYTGRQIKFGNDTSGEFVRIDENGFLGINSDDPVSKLTLVDGDFSLLTGNQQGIYMGPTSNSYANFGSGVPTIHIQGTATNNRAGAIRFKENDDSDTGAIYSTNGADGYGGMVLASYQGDMKFAMGAISSNKMILTQDGEFGIGKSPTVQLDVEKTSTGGTTGTYPTIRVNNPNTDLTGGSYSVSDIQVGSENNFLQGQLAAVSVTGGTDRYIRLAALSNHRMQLMTNSQERMSISAGGQVGVGDFGATDPASGFNGTNLEIKDGTVARLILNDTGGDKISIGSVANKLSIYNESDDQPAMVINTEEHTVTHTNFGFRIGTVATASSFSATTMFDVDVPYAAGGTGIFGVIRLAVSLSGELGLNAAANRSQEVTITFSRNGANSGGGNTSAEFAIDLGSATATNVGSPDITGMTITVNVPAASAATQTCNVQIAGTANTSVIFRVKGAGQYMGDSSVNFVNLIN